MLTKPKKEHKDKDIHSKQLNCPQKQAESSKSSLVVTRRKGDTTNKENYIQITEPLDSVGLTSQSK